MIETQNIVFLFVIQNNINQSMMPLTLYYICILNN